MTMTPSPPNILLRSTVWGHLCFFVFELYSSLCPFFLVRDCLFLYVKLLIIVACKCFVYILSYPLSLILQIFFPSVVSMVVSVRIRRASPLHGDLLTLEKAPPPQTKAPNCQSFPRGFCLKRACLFQDYKNMHSVYILEI